MNSAKIWMDLIVKTKQSHGIQTRKKKNETQLKLAENYWSQFETHGLRIILGKNIKKMRFT